MRPSALMLTVLATTGLLFRCGPPVGPKSKPAPRAADPNKPQMDCDRLCNRWSRCTLEYMEARGTFQPETLKAVRADPKATKKVTDQMRTSCHKTCIKWNKQKKWTPLQDRHVKECMAEKDCAGFGKCVVKHKI